MESWLTYLSSSSWSPPPVGRQQLPRAWRWCQPESSPRPRSPASSRNPPSHEFRRAPSGQRTLLSSHDPIHQSKMIHRPTHKIMPTNEQKGAEVSCTLRSFDWMRIPSAGRRSPYLIWQMSPTTISLTAICLTSPCRITANLCSPSILLCNPRNCRSFV